MDTRRQKPGSDDPRRLSCQILDRVDRGRARAAGELAHLGDSLTHERNLGLATELVYGTLRHRSELDYHLTRLSGRPLEQIEPPLLSLLRIGLYQILHLNRIPPSAAVNESVRLAKEAKGQRAGGFVNAVLRKACRQRQELRLPEEGEDPIGLLALRYSVPRWMASRWWHRLGPDETRDLLRSFAHRAPLSIWVNPGKTDAERLAIDLEKEGVICCPSPLLPEALRIIRGRPQRTRVFRLGHFYVQDEASQAVVYLIHAEPGEFLVDLCAAPGGKTWGTACRVGQRGRVLAVDRQRSRLRTLLSNRDRLDLANVLPLVADAEQASPLVRQFVGVLVDAPCSGTGILRRHPEIRWRRQPMDLPILAARQARLLRSAASLVIPGGRLVYSVCSLEPEEGEDQITAFLEEHPEFELGDAGAYLPSGLASAVTSQGCFQTWPHRHETDGFFAAVFRRREGAGSLGIS